jgi:geranylgeranyl diphosphate synthase type I
MMVDLLDEVSLVAGRVNDQLKRLSSDHSDELSQVAFHLIKLGGKRLRPFVLVKCCELVGGSAEDALPAAVSIELLHNFTLIHDDVMDKDDFRHGAPTVHKVYGEPAAIIAGDMLFALVFKHVCEAFWKRNVPPSITQRVVEVLSEAAIIVCEGQWMDMSLQNRRDTTEETYLSLVAKKTGHLYRASALIGGIVGGAKGEALRSLSVFGERVGQAFQVADDLLGAVGDSKKTGKPVGSDMRNGKSTIIFLHALRTATPENRRIILKAFGNQGASKEEVAAAVEALGRTGSIEYGKAMARQLSERAKAELVDFPDSVNKSLLQKFSDFVVERGF